MEHHLTVWQVATAAYNWAMYVWQWVQLGVTACAVLAAVFGKRMTQIEAERLDYRS